MASILLCPQASQQTDLRSLGRSLKGDILTSTPISSTLTPILSSSPNFRSLKDAQLCAISKALPHARYSWNIPRNTPPRSPAQGSESHFADMKTEAWQAKQPALSHLPGKWHNRRPQSWFRASSWGNFVHLAEQVSIFTCAPPIATTASCPDISIQPETTPKSEADFVSRNCDFPKVSDHIEKEQAVQ